MRRLWLIRHGLTDWSEAGRLCGWTDIPLNGAGRVQAVTVGQRLDGQELDGVWASDLSRARETSRLAHGGAMLDARLRELDFGELEGMKWEDCDRATQDALQRFDGFAAPGGESVAELRDRVVGFLTLLGRGSHAIFTHGGVIRLLTSMLGVEGAPAPGSVTVLDWGGAE